MTTPSPADAALLGALVADAAALGLHWIYDPTRIAEVAGAEAAFTPLDAANYEGVPAYFAHAARHDGAQSQYGEVLALALRNLDAAQGLDIAQYQAAYAAHFGAGGAYCGYIDRPTRGTLANLAAEQTDPSGVDDDQLPALSTLPAVVARYPADPGLSAHVAQAIRVTHVNDAATRYGQIFAQCLAGLLTGQSLDAALTVAATQDEALQAALDSSEADSVAYGEITGRACHLHQGLPLAFHILSRSSSYAQAVELNIRAGGDSCGRAIVIGALAGAAYGTAAIPLHWILATDSAKTHWARIQRLSRPS